MPVNTRKWAKVRGIIACRCCPQQRFDKRQISLAPPNSSIVGYGGLPRCLAQPPTIIIVCSLLSTTAVFTALWLTGVELNITALMGMTMIIGIGTEMAIFYMSELEELSREMPARDAVREASRNRLRPITMTTLAAILTLLPLALAIGQGSGIQQPLAIAIIAGLLLQYPLVLIAMPVLTRLTLPRERPDERVPAAAVRA